MKQLLSDISRTGIEDHIARLEGVRHPATAPEALERAAEYIWNRLQEYGYEMSEHSFFDNGGTYRNLLATLRGCEEPERRLLIVAHYDTVAGSPGADDNASGVALLLELARIFRNRRPRRSLQFVAVNLEENEREEHPKGFGLRGSRALARHAGEQDWLIDGVIVLESVAYAGLEAVQTVPEGLPVAVPETGDFIAVIGNAASADLAAAFVEAADHHQPELAKVPLIVPGNGELFPDTRRSDHAPFWDLGFPAIMLTDTTNFRSPHYHQPSDTLETLNLDFATAVCRATAGLIHLLDEGGIA
jgi:acetylornithine deacetylase/succinyl-diaminopimelate desuccinylase-like protein